MISIIKSTPKSEQCHKLSTTDAKSILEGGTAAITVTEPSGKVVFMAILRGGRFMGSENTAHLADWSFETIHSYLHWGGWDTISGWWDYYFERPYTRNLMYTVFHESSAVTATIPSIPTFNVP